MELLLKRIGIFIAVSVSPVLFFYGILAFSFLSTDFLLLDNHVAGGMRFILGVIFLASMGGASFLAIEYKNK